MLVIRSLSKSVPGTSQARRTLFSALDLDVAAGEFVAIMGESGVGKSTLLNLIAGLDTPDRGSIAIEGKELAGLDETAAEHYRRACDALEEREDLTILSSYAPRLGRKLCSLGRLDGYHLR